MKELIEKVYTDERPKLLSWMKTRISHEDAEDILHTAVIRSLQNLDSLAGIKDLTAWLWRSAQNGETFTSISARTGIPMETLAARKRYALEKLRKLLVAAL